MFARLAIPLLLVVGCNSASSTGIPPVSCPPTGTTLTYDNFGQALMETAILQYSNAILDEAVYTDAMPEDSDMALSERELLGEWLACGAP